MQEIEDKGLTKFQQELLDAAKKMATFEANHDPYVWDDNEREEYQALEAAFLTLVRKAWDKDMVVDPIRNLIND